MDDEERKAQIEDERTKSDLERDSKKGNKSKFKMALTRMIMSIIIIPMLKVTAIILLITALFTAISYLIDYKGDNNISSIASKSALEEHVDIAKDDENGYYFKIDKELIDDYLRLLNEAYHKGYYLTLEPEEDEDLPEYDYEKAKENDELYITEDDLIKIFGTKDYEPYLIKMIRAEIASSYPKLGEYSGNEDKKDKQGNMKDKDGNYVAQGVVEVQRTKMDKNGNPAAEAIPLKYLPYMTEEEKLESENQTNNQENENNENDDENTNPNDNENNPEDEDINQGSNTPSDGNLQDNNQSPNTLGGQEPKSFRQLVDGNYIEALDYFSFDENSGVIYYARYTEIESTLNGETTSYSYRIDEEPISYKSITSMCSMPYDFLFSLLQKSQNPEYVMKVVDLLLVDTKVVLMVQDQLEVSEYMEVSKQVQRKDQRVDTEVIYQVPSIIIVNGKPQTTYTTRTINRPGTPVTLGYTFPAPEPPGQTDTEITTTWENTANVYLREARTWCMDFIQRADLETSDNRQIDEYRTGLPYTNNDYKSLEYYKVNETSSSATTGNTKRITVTTTYLSQDKLPYHTEDIEHSYTWNTIIEKKDINYERFLGLWANKLGEYPKDGIMTDDYLFKAEDRANMKKVGYYLPDDVLLTKKEQEDEELEEGKEEEEDKEWYLDKTVKSYPADVIPSNNGQDLYYLLLNLSRHEELEMQEQLMMYFWNKYTGEDWYDVNIENLLDLFNTDVFTPIGGSTYGTIAINGCNIDREDFIKAIESVNFTAVFKQNAGIIYDICKSNDINPILCASVAAHESNYGKNTPANSKYNYWGIGVYNNSNTGIAFSTISEAAEYWCKLIKKYQTPGSSEYSMIVNRSIEFSSVNNKYTGGVNNIYDIWSIYAYLGDTHNSKVYGTVNVKEYITRYLTDINCDHNLNDPTTTEEKAAYIVNYVDRGIAKVAKNIFGNLATGGKGAGVVDFALNLVGQGHKTFTSYYNVKDNWCAMFVSYCYDKCGLIPSVLPKSYLGCSDEVRFLRNKGLFRERTSKYIPKAGDIIFFKGTTDISGHTGIVTNCDGIKVYTVEGNAGDSTTGDWRGRKVTTKEYSLTSTRIVGYFES